MSGVTNSKEQNLWEGLYPKTTTVYLWNIYAGFTTLMEEGLKQSEEIKVKEGEKVNVKIVLIKLKIGKTNFFFKNFLS